MAGRGTVLLLPIGYQVGVLGGAEITRGYVVAHSLVEITDLVQRHPDVQLKQVQGPDVLLLPLAELVTERERVTEPGVLPPGHS